MAKLYDRTDNNRRVNRVNQNVVHYAYDISNEVEKYGGIYDAEVIKQSITNIILTQRGERLFNPGFGTDLYTIILNSNSSTVTESKIKKHVIDMVLLQEDRVTINDRESTVTYNPDTYELRISLKFRIKDSAKEETWDNTIQI